MPTASGPAPFRSFRVSGGRLFDIPGAPTVGTVRLPNGQIRWTKLTDEIVRYYKEVAADAINQFANTIANRSLREVPKGPREDSPYGHRGQFEEGSLAESIKAPFNDPESRADETYLTAWVSYDTVYAGVQHEGIANMMHTHPIIPGKLGFFEKTSVEEPHLIEWVVENYTTPGTKSHYLSDPYKAAVPEFQPFMYRKVREAFLG